MASPWNRQKVHLVSPNSTHILYVNPAKKDENVREKIEPSHCFILFLENSSRVF